ncbi:MAG: family 16 glycosylhydrolase [Spirochaetes bacterium]|nr:family 16 glycosylhydrolase [Spirochaetota bacterium]
MLRFVIVCFCSAVILSAVPPSDRYTLMYADEFDGPLNMKEWTYRTGARFNGLNLPGNVRTENGRLCIDFKKEIIGGSNQYTCGGIISKRIFGYGYFETKAKLHGKSGLHSSFWTMGVAGDGVNTPKANQLTEIDGYEIDSIKPKNIAFNRHTYVGSHKSHGHAIYPEIDSSTDDFTAGFEWLPGKIIFYINGKPVFTNVTVRREFYGPQNQWFTALAWDLGKAIDDSALPGVSSWDYFRYYARDLVGVNLAANGDFEFNDGPSFEKSFRRNMQLPVSWIEDGDADASIVSDQPKAFSKGYALKHISDKTYAVTTRQHIPFIMPATYRLSAMVKSSGGKINARMRVYGHGGVEMNIAVPHSGEWQKITIDNISVSGMNGAMIAFTSEAEAGQWLAVDAVEFVQMTGIRSDEFDDAVAVKDPARIVVYPDEPEFICEGPWKESSLLGYANSPSKYLDAKDNGSVWWRPDIVQAGEYRVSLYRLGRAGNVKAAKITVTHDKGMNESTLDLTEGGNDWVEIGVFTFAKGTNGNVLMKGDGSGYLRADAARFELIK